MNVTALCDVTHAVLWLGPTASETAVSSETLVPV